MRRVTRARQRHAWLLGLCLALAAPAAAQHEPARDVLASDVSAQAKGQDKETALALQVLRERNRETLHPGDPLTIVGLEQGDNEFRSGTPALVNGAHAVALMDPEDAYNRALAMYEGGAVFHQPPAPFVAAEEASEVEVPKPAPVRVEAGKAVPGRVSLALLLAVGLLVGLALRRRLRIVLRLRRARA